MIDEEKKEMLEKEEDLKTATPEIRSNYERVVLEEKRKETNETEIKEGVNNAEHVEEKIIELKESEKENIEEEDREDAKLSKEVLEKDNSKEKIEEEIIKSKDDSQKDKMVKEETYEKNTKITGDLLDKKEISFDVHKLIYSKSYYKVESVLSVLKKEINENNYQEIINLLNESKYNNDFEIRGFLFAYLIDKKIEEPTNIIKNLNVDEVLATYMFALINEKDKKKRKNIEKLMKEEISLSDNKHLKKLAIESKKLEEDKKQYQIKKMSKFASLYITYLKKSEAIDNILESISKYVFREYSLQKPKLINKIYIENRVKFKKLPKETNNYLNICLAKGYLNCHYIAKAKKMYLEILKGDPNNYDAEEGLMLIKNGYPNVYSLVYNKNICKDKKFKEFESKMKEQSDLSVQGIKEIYEKEEKIKKEAREVRLRNIRKVLAGFFLAIVIILVLMQMFIKKDLLKTIIIVFASIYSLTSFIRRGVKKSIVPFIVRLLIASLFVALAIIMPDLISKLLNI